MLRSDPSRILTAQGLRALSYGFGSVLLGVSLQARGWSSTQGGLLLTAIVAGMGLMSALVGRYGDRIGRRRIYALLFVALAGSGAVFGLADNFWLLSLVALTGALSTEVVESGPLSSLEQVMLSAGLGQQARTRLFGLYNTIAALSGSAGALLAGGPGYLRHVWPGVPAEQRFFLVFVPVGLMGALLGWSLSERVEGGRLLRGRPAPLSRSRGSVRKLAGLFATDAFAGGFVLQAFIAYWFGLRFGASPQPLGFLFFGVGLLQAGSFLVATRLAGKIGLLNTMVFTHLPSNLLLASIPLAPTLPVAIALLLGRFALSQMDVPTRQAYVIALVDPEERTAAAAYTNTARYIVRPLGPILAGVSQQVVVGMPFVLAGGIKPGYDLVLWSCFRRVRLTPDESEVKTVKEG